MRYFLNIFSPDTYEAFGSEIDDNTARVILQFLLTNKQEDLTALATAESINDLTAEQKQKLLDLAKSAATYMRGVAATGVELFDFPHETPETEATTTQPKTADDFINNPFR